jgi:hypothetical protein
MQETDSPSVATTTAVDVGHHPAELAWSVVAVADLIVGRLHADTAAVAPTLGSMQGPVRISCLARTTIVRFNRPVATNHAV